MATDDALVLATPAVRDEHGDVMGHANVVLTIDGHVEERWPSTSAWSPGTYNIDPYEIDVTDLARRLLAIGRKRLRAQKTLNETSAELHALVQQARAAGMSKPEIARRAGISRPTLDAMLKRGKE